MRQGIAGMVDLQDRAVHVVAQLMHAAAKLAHMIEFQTHGLLPKRQLFFALIGIQADVQMLFRQIHWAAFLLLQRRHI